MKIYLCGPINGCTDAEAKDWRNSIQTEWGWLNRFNHKWIDPMRRDYRGKELENVREIVELDKIDVASSDIVLVNFDKPSVGTSMEILFAWQLGKRIITVIAPGTTPSPWLIYHSTHVVHSFYDAARLIEKASHEE